MRSPEIHKTTVALGRRAKRDTGMRNRLGSVASAFAVGLAFGCALFGQADHPKQQKSPAPPADAAPRASSTPDLSGVWNAASGLYEYAAFSKDEPPMTSWGQAQFATAKPSQGPHGVKLDETNDRVYKCAPPGVPYIYIQLFPMQIIQTPKEVIEFFEYDHVVRYIYTDGRKHPDDLLAT
jgi:hypothetical protein